MQKLVLAGLMVIVTLMISFFIVCSNQEVSSCSHQSTPVSVSTISK